MILPLNEIWKKEEYDMVMEGKGERQRWIDEEEEFFTCILLHHPEIMWNPYR